MNVLLIPQLSNTVILKAASRWARFNLQYCG